MLDALSRRGPRWAAWARRHAATLVDRPPTPPTPPPRAAKPRGSIDDAVRARRECVPCRDAARPLVLPGDAERLLSAIPATPHESLDWLRRFAAGGPDPAADVRRYAGPVEARSPASPPVYLWLHVAVLGSWESILRELLSAIERSGLLAAASGCFAGVVGPDADLSWLPPWLTVVRRDGLLELGENSTLESLWAWSKTAEPSKVVYLHVKGASHRDRNPNVTAWRDYLVDFTILRWREASARLDGACDCCGCDWTERDDAWFARVGGRTGPGLQRGNGFEGNFWWARSDYLAALPADSASLGGSRYDAEWSFVGAGNPRAEELHDAGVDLYRTFYPRSAYRENQRRGSHASAHQL